ncbi:MAG: cadherin domain-containing protein [Verrucomicrobiaceae bacterium]|nr:cadherin domain-containing protein [Verrucomicrobiaceae bacterium]
MKSYSRFFWSLAVCLLASAPLLAVAQGPLAQVAYVKPSVVDPNFSFGSSVAISGDTAVVGAYQRNNETGAVFVYVRAGDGTWSEQAILQAGVPGYMNQFGWRVAISGDTLVVGAPGEGSGVTGINGNENDQSSFFAGAAYVFTRTAGVWTKQAYLKASNTGFVDRFGSSVAIDGDTIVVGAEGESSSATGVGGDENDDSASNAGAAYVFTRTAGTWSQQAYLKSITRHTTSGYGDKFGSAVAISGDTIVVGAQHEGSSATGVDGDHAVGNASQSGAAYVYLRTAGVWAGQAYLKASNTGVGDKFGYSVSIAGDSIVVGAPFEDSIATGMNGNQADNSFDASGAAYLFERTGAAWAQQAYVKTSQHMQNQQFGVSTSMSGDQMVIGAQRDSSMALGVGGAQNVLAGENVGAAHHFKRAAGVWGFAHYIKANIPSDNDLFGISVAISGDTIVAGAQGEDSSTSGINNPPTGFRIPGLGAAYIYSPVNVTPSVVQLPDITVNTIGQRGGKGGTVTGADNIRGFGSSSSTAFSGATVYAGDTVRVRIKPPAGKNFRLEPGYGFVVAEAEFGIQMLPRDVGGATFNFNVTSGPGFTPVFGDSRWSISNSGIGMTAISYSQPSAAITANYVDVSFTSTVSAPLPAKPFATLVFYTSGSTNYPYLSLVDAVAPANNAPTNIALSNATLAENNAPGATVGTLTATDADAGDTHTFSLAGGADDSAFTITGTTLSLNGSADYETKSSYSIRVRATDSGVGNLFFEKDFTVTILDVDQPQSITFNLPASALPTDTVTLTATGGPSGNPVTFQVVSGPGSITAGVLSFTARGDVVVRASQLGSGDYTAAPDVEKTITVLNRAPVAEDDFVTSNLATVVISPLGNDSDPDGDTLTIIDVGDPGTGSVTTDGTTITYVKDTTTFDDQDGFTYTVSDGMGGTSTAAVILATYGSLAGSYTGLLDDGNGRADGMYRATVGTTGIVTARCFINGRSLAMNGRLDTNGFDTLSSGGVDFTLQAQAANAIPGEPRQHLQVTALDTGVTYTGNAIAHLYSNSSQVPPAQIGNYNTAQTAVAGQSGLPASPGWLRVLVTKNGNVTISGRAPDVLPVSAASAIVEGGEIAFYANAVGSNPKSEYGGQLSITLGGAVTGALTFDKTVQSVAKGAFHATGFSGNYETSGGFYIVPAAGERILTTNGAGGVTATFTGAGYASPFSKSLTLTTSNTFTALPSPPLSALTLRTASGILGGSVKSPTNTTMVITGLAVPTGGSVQAIGCFLYTTGAYEGGEVKVIAAP